MFAERVRGRGLRSFLSVSSLILLVLVADGAYAALGFRSEMKSAACSLRRAVDSLEAFELDAADSRLDRALEDARRARSLLSHPSVGLASVVPRLGDDVDALRALAQVAESAALAGDAGVAAASDMGLGAGGSLGQIYRDGQVHFDAIAEGEEAVGAAVAHVRDAERVLDTSPVPRLGPVRGAFFGAARLVERAGEAASDAETVLERVPSLLGDVSPKRYFLAFQAPSEARGGGGLLGVYGVLRVADGRLSLTKVAPIRSLVPLLKRSVAGPRWYKQLYKDLDGLGGWREANQSPNFPAVARIWLRMYEASTGETLDGAIAMDPLVVAQLTKATGPLKVAGFAEPVGPKNAGRILMRDIYLRFVRREDEQNVALRNLVDALWEKVGAGDIEGIALARGLARGIATQHLKMFSADAADQQAIVAMGLAGDPTAYGPNVQMVFHNNFAANKIDWFLERSQDTTIALRKDGSARVITRVHVENRAPKGRRSLLKKSDVNELPAGLNVMSVHFMLPMGARLDDLYIDDIAEFAFRGREGGTHPVAWTPVRLKVQDDGYVSVVYEVPDLVTFEKGKATFEMSFIPQALVRPDRFSLNIVAPDGHRIVRDRPGARAAKQLTIDGTLDEVRKVKATVLEPGEALPEEADLAGECA